MTSADSGMAEEHSRGTILLVEDEPFLREATARLLQSSGFDVIEAANAKRALELFQENDGHIDVLMTDLSLPGGSGVQLGRNIRRRSPDIPILFTSGYFNGGCDDGQVDGFAYYLPKPYMRAELVAKIEQILQALPLRRTAAG